MNIRQFIWVAVFCLGLPLSAVDWKAETLKADRWTKVSAGTMTITNDPKENGALRFETEIKPGKALWTYPLFKLRDGESLGDAVELRFEIKAKTEGKASFSCMQISKKMLRFPIPIERWKRVRISLSKADIDLEQVKEFQIGINPAKHGKSIFWIRNFQVIDQKTADAEKTDVPVTAVDWKKETSFADRWTKVSAGTMTIASDPEEGGALRFVTEIAPEKPLWTYPLFQLEEGESLEGAVEFRFDIKSKTKGTPFFSCVQIGGKMLSFVIPKGNWETIRIPLANRADIDLKKARQFQIGFNPAKPGESTFWLRNFQAVDQKTIDAEKKAVPIFFAAESKAPSNVFYDSEQVEFKLKDGHRLPCSYRVADAFGREVATGPWPENGYGTLMLKNLPRGYYTLMLDNKKKYAFREPLSFTVVAKTNPNPESYFAIDTAQSWLCHAYPDARFPNEKYERISELCLRAGVGIIRERLSWADTEKIPGQFTWDKYMRNADYLHSRGVTILGLYSDSPEWARMKRWRMPDDLLAVYRYSKRTGKDFDGKMVAWEYWNEPDGHYAGSAWELAAGAKAASLGFWAANPKLLMLTGSFCSYPLRTFVMTALKNDLLDYADIFNYHIYKELSQYPEIVKHLRDTLAKFRRPNMPIWITENGTRAEGLGVAESYRPNLMIHSPRQEMFVAEFLPKGLILLQNLGIARDFFFVLPAFNEGRKDWGLVRRDQTVKPGYTAFANLNHQLSYARLLGEVILKKGVRAFLYEQKNGSQTLVVWSESEIDNADAEEKEIPVEIPQKNGKYTAANNFGTVFDVYSGKGKICLTATRYPLYIKGLHGLKADRKPLSAGIFERRKDKELAIVLRPILGKEFSISVESSEMSSIPGKMTLQVWNLSPENKQGKLTVSGAKAEDLPSQVVLKPFEKKEYELVITPDLPNGAYKGKLEFGGEFSGKPISRMVIPLLQTAWMPSRDLDYRDPAKWKANSPGTMNISYDKSEDAIRFHTVFKQGAALWIYPEYVLAPSDSLKHAAGIRFEIKAEKKDIAHGLAFSTAIVSIDGKDQWLVYPAATDQWETRVVPFDNVNPEQVKNLRIGMNPKCNDFTYYIRNLKIYYDPPEKK